MNITRKGFLASLLGGIAAFFTPKAQAHVVGAKGPEKVAWVGPFHGPTVDSIRLEEASSKAAKAIQDFAEARKEMYQVFLDAGEDAVKHCEVANAEGQKILKKLEKSDD